MKRPLRSLALTLVLVAAATMASAQAPKSSNPAARSDRDSFYYGSIHGAPQRDPISSPLNGGQNGIGRPVGRYGPVTPVPEPSQWAMMLAGLALVGWIVRRNGKK
jgi:hypothetical protein